MCILQVLPPWDATKFNFTKALQKEVLFQFEASDMPTKGSSFVPLAPVAGKGNASSIVAVPTYHVSVSSFFNWVACQRGSYLAKYGLRMQQALAHTVMLCAGSPNLVFINVSPIEYGHVLLVPRALSKLNQQVDVPSLQLALQFAHEANNPYFRLAFNSLGAYGTVNHLHFQVCPFAVMLILSNIISHVAQVFRCLLHMLS